MNNNDKRLNLGTAKWLLTGAKALLDDPDLQEWHGLKRSELLWLVSDITGKEVLDEAIAALEKIIESGISPTIPPDLEELVADLDKYQQEVAKGQKITEEQIRQLRASIVGAQLAQQTKGDLYVAPAGQTITVKPPAQSAEEPIPFRQFRQPLPSRPAPAPAASTAQPTLTASTRPVTTVYVPPPAESIRQAQPVLRDKGEPATKTVFVVQKSIAQPLLRRLSNAPTRILRNVIAVGEEAVGGGPAAAQKAYAARLLNQGITSTSFRGAIEEYAKGTTGEKGVIQALLKQADVLAEYEGSHLFLSRVTKSLFPAHYNQILIANQAAQPEPGVTVKNLRAEIDPFTNYIKRLDYLRAGEEAVPTQVVSAIREDLTQQTVTARQNFFSRLSIGIRNLPGYIGRLLGSKPTGAIAGAGARGGASLLGGAIRGLGGFGGGIARAGAGIVSAIGAGGGGAAIGISGGVIAVIIGLAVAIPLLFLLMGMTHQGAYLGEQIEIEESQFISVSKTATKTTFTNEELPQEVEFRITVAPKQGKLIKVKVTDSFSISGNGTATLPEKSWDAGDIETSWTENFQVTLPATLKDNLVINYVTVRAEIENQPTQTATTSLVLTVGGPPQDCPLGEPTSGYVNQGPNGGASHGGLEAIDIHNNKGTIIKATHKGVAKVTYDNGGKPSWCTNSKWNPPGKNVVISGMCNGKAFTSRYAHFEFVNEAAINGKEITRGTELGIMGDSGCANLPHLHYQFNGLEMKPPNIPKPVPYGCVGSCNVSFP